MSFINTYLSVLNEDNKKPSNVVADNTGELEGSEKVKSFVKDSGPDAATTPEKPVKGPHSECDPESLPEPVKSESSNPFDALYNKIISEEGELEGSEDGHEFDFSGEVEDGEDFEHDLESPEGTEEHEEGEEEGLESVLDHLKNAVSALEKLIDSSKEDVEEVEGEEGEEGSEEHEAEEVPAMEAVEAEVVGHALVDSEKLESGLTKHSSQAVKGAVPVKSTSKKAEVVKGKKADGKPEEFKGETEKLKGKTNNVGGVTAGKGLFDQ
jgi:hypothetical protein